MKIFSEEPPRGKNPDSVVLIMSLKEARTLMELVEAGCETNKRKKLWKEMKKSFEDQLCCY